MKNVKLILVLVASMVIGGVAFNNCSEVGFSNATSAKASGVPTENPEGGNGNLGDDVGDDDNDGAEQGDRCENIPESEARDPEVDLMAEYGPDSNHSKSRPHEENNSGKYNAGHCVKVCHVPPGNPDAQHTIVISVAALRAHLGNHGDGEVVDYSGECKPLVEAQ
ncbi:MAG: hypothetical protein A4S09_04385 [Proteobacteria bacterium SG_bin7]|nr:MAG: hypothetical protein A4S09_04385 [Proteobacteria bacterium SG_bin7]